MKEKLVLKLNELIEAGSKKSQLEEEIGLPANSLSAVLSSKKEMPDSWVEKIKTFLNKKEPQTKLVVEKSGLKEKPADHRFDKIRELNAKINSDFGEGTIMLFGDKPNTDVEVVSTGSLGLDEALVIGGLPRGRIIEIFGLESSGKTTIALHVIAEAQKKGLKCLLIDAENSFDPEYAANIGVEVEELSYCQPSCGEHGLEVADKQISSGQYGVVVIDSVAALVPKAELEGQMGDSKMGLHARLMSQACRKMTASISKTNTVCIFINQLRNKIGIAWGNPEVTTGGLALQFYASIRLDVRKLAQIKDGELSIGNKVKVKVVKNKLAPPFKTVEFDIIYGEGIDSIGEIIDAAILKNVIQKSGSWFAYGDVKLGQGRESLRTLLKDNAELLSEIKNKIA